MRNRTGFTLIEVLVSLVILSGVLMLAYQVMSGALEAETRSERWTAATLLGEGLLRESTATFPAIEETDGKFPAPDDDYTWKRSVRPFPLPLPDVREVHVTVLWKVDGLEEGVTLSGIASK